MLALWVKHLLLALDEAMLQEALGGWDVLYGILNWTT